MKSFSQTLKQKKNVLMKVIKINNTAPPTSSTTRTRYCQLLFSLFLGTETWKVFHISLMESTFKTKLSL